MTHLHFREGWNISHPKGEDLQSGLHRVSVICDTHPLQLSTINNEIAISVPAVSQPKRYINIMVMLHTNPFELRKLPLAYAHLLSYAALLLVEGGLFSICSIT